MMSTGAIVAALAMLEHPSAARLAQSASLPKGVTFLLEVAAGEAHALREASQITGRSEEVLQKAAAFFIEQILLQPGADSYRILGGDRQSSAGELRRNMALIMRWLHPDVVSNGSCNNRFDKSLYAVRVAQAWELVKTDMRRAAYDASLPSRQKKLTRSSGNSKSAAANNGTYFPSAVPGGNVRRPMKLHIERAGRQGIWSQFLRLLGGQRW